MGTVTFLFSDIEGSTRLWEDVPEAMKIALEKHDALLHGIIARHDGHTFKTVGDQFCVVFQLSIDAVRAALEMQNTTRAETWELPRPIRIRIGKCTGDSCHMPAPGRNPARNRTGRRPCSVALG